MKPKLPMSMKLREQFRDSGYVVVPSAVPQEIIERWRRDAERMSANARSIRRTDGNFQLTYRVVTGERIREEWPELFAFYGDKEVVEWVKHVTGEASIYISPNVMSAINLNIMDDTESVYRWHFDAEPYTALLYLTDVGAEDGGTLEIVANCAPHQAPDLAVEDPLRFHPAAGTLLLMDGTRCYHRATQMLRSVLRFSVPMVYVNKVQQRPDGLDSYLYEPSA